MTDLTASSDAFARTKKSVGGGVSSGARAGVRPHPIFAERGSGSHLWDISGNEYVDYVMGWGPLILGHSHPEVIAEVSKVLPLMQSVGMGHRYEYLAAEAVLDVVPGAERLLWTNTGTEAVQVALRLARAATGRNGFVKFVSSYHGWHDSVLASVGVHDGGQEPTSNTRGQNPHALKDLIVLPFNDVDQIRSVLTRARELGIGAVLLDPVQSNAGLHEPDPVFLNTLRSLCTENGVVLIFDQVIAGFRVALGGATERYGVTPDLSVFGKAIAGGFPHAAVAGRADLVDSVSKGVVHAGTYNGNPISLAAVLATMKVLKREGTYDRLETVAADLQGKLIEALAAAPSITTRRIGGMLAIAEDGTEPKARIWPQLSGELVHHEILALPTGKIFVSTEHGNRDSTVFAEAVEKSLSISEENATVSSR
ncbi:aspartate aminotransferase family protein [Rhodococcus sp. 06-156-3C]|uniref:aspartate aminotransferase family protein n=1 Tax=Nocardiaceae TaxID=85025 RepID=UPI00052304BE|nr:MULTISPECIES: aminotransferase class III-fold pyridoxal phosphate-dependent enzyme [Rhodococcus]OZD18367.1 aspartate aminotransferase family protein [Rhodococcus sp. 06-156-4C]OZD18964.1 aspartate aminotransferase family protein [Rhodococcus sp. 06-156-3C]OZD22477.1 aspartate aminotransferase family protein [Rhodococcus sp. 06-156-4a]OZD34148.1 aspartate aminotransferase family protein [Rhodococcus sp. 06-156-3b]OZD38885.1 aspartate aminotransferase family protein [Rhodococcus sp. 06-156-3]